MSMHCTSCHRIYPGASSATKICPNCGSPLAVKQRRETPSQIVTKDTIKNINGEISNSNSNSTPNSATSSPRLQNSNTSTRSPLSSSNPLSSSYQRSGSLNELQNKTHENTPVLKKQSSEGSLPTASGGAVPIWEKERLQEEERRRQSMAVRSQVATIIQQVAESSKLQNYHPGLYKTSYRENMDSSGTVLLKPDGMIWGCCKSTNESAPGCRSTELSPYHLKCGKCGEFYLEHENKAKGCAYHSGSMCKPPSLDEDILAFQCCMKPVPSRGCQAGKHVSLSSYKPNPNHASGPLAPASATAKKFSGASTGSSSGAKSTSPSNGPSNALSWNKTAPTKATKKFDPTKIKTKEINVVENTKSNANDGSGVPIWERERQEQEDRRKQSMMIRNMKTHLKQQAAQTLAWTNSHPGIFKTTYREQMDPSTGGVTLKPEGRLWTCCRQPQEASGGCQQMQLSPLFDKCNKCGAFYLEVDNKDKICSYHNGNITRPPDTDSDIVVYQCCMKQVGARGCQLGRHVPNTSFSHNSGAKSAANQSAKESAQKLQLDLLEKAIRSVLAGIKTVYGVIESKAKISDVVTSCKSLVSEIHNLDTHSKSLQYEPLTKSVEDFKTAVSHIIKSVQTACKLNYNDQESLQDVKNACNASVSAAKIVVARAKSVPANSIESASLNSNPYGFSSKSPSRNNNDDGPGPPPPPPPMGGPPGPPPPPGPMPPGSGTKKKAGGKGEVLGAIGGFNKGGLRKVVTVDKSKPVRTGEFDEEEKKQ